MGVEDVGLGVPCLYVFRTTLLVAVNRCGR